MMSNKASPASANRSALGALPPSRTLITTPGIWSRQAPSHRAGGGYRSTTPGPCFYPQVGYCSSRVHLQRETRQPTPVVGSTGQFTLLLVSIRTASPVGLSESASQNNHRQDWLVGAPPTQTALSTDTRVREKQHP